MIEQQKFHPEHEFLHEIFSGELTRDEVDAAFRVHSEDPRFDKVRAILCDERRVTGYAFGVAEVRDYATDRTAVASLYAGKKWAVVSEEARLAALALLFEQSMPSEVDVKVFATIEAALDWLDVSPAARTIVALADRKLRDASS